MQTSMNDQANQGVARAWALLDRAEHQARQSVREEIGPSLWLLAANSIQRARDALEAIHPQACQPVGVKVLPDGNCQDLIRAAFEQLASIPKGHEPAGLSLALVHLAEAEHEVGAVLFVNTPTVHELIQDASRQVRSIMWDVSALDGPGLAAAWPAFAGHARDALSAVPVPDVGTRLLIIRTAGPWRSPNRWGPPVDAEPDPHLVSAGQALAAVAELLRRHASPPRSPQAQHDTDAVCRRIAECLLVGSHATALGWASTRPGCSRLAPASPPSNPGSALRSTARPWRRAVA
jgi:hypothetical protein